MRMHLYLICTVSTLVMFPAIVFAADDKYKSSDADHAPKSELAEGLDAFSTQTFPDVKSGSLGYALLHGTPWIDARYRYESVDQDAIANNAKASTLRTRIGYTTGLYEGFKAGVAVDNLTSLGSEDYNNGYNRKTTYPTVFDAEDNVLDQLYVSYQGLPKTTVTLGRQVINLDNQRFIGANEWRQHQQTLDAISIDSQFIDKASFYYAYVKKVNRWTGPDSPTGAYESDSHLINASYAFDPALKVTAYSYLLDFDDAPTSSNASYGARLSGKYSATNEIKLLYTLEGATQSDYGKNTLSVDENYYLIEPGISWNGWTAKAGYEVLTGNGTSAFQTPLASLYTFNGWVDKFITTPANGLEDAYVSMAYKVPFGPEFIKGTEIKVMYHDFQSNNTSADYGTEWDTSISQTFYDHHTIGLKYSSYETDGFSKDTQKAVLYVGVKY